MRKQDLWPGNRRHLLTDAFGVMLLADLYRETADPRLLTQARAVVSSVHEKLGQARGLSASDAVGEDSQYYHYLVLWASALAQLGVSDTSYHDAAIKLITQIHPAFVLPGHGVYARLRRDLKIPVGTGSPDPLNPFYGYVTYRLIDREALAREIAELASLVDTHYEQVYVRLAPEAAMLLWLSTFFPDERWAFTSRNRSLQALDYLWHEGEGCFVRDHSLPGVKAPHENYAACIALSAAGEWPQRVERIHEVFDRDGLAPNYKKDPLTLVLRAASYYLQRPG